MKENYKIDTKWIIRAGLGLAILLIIISIFIDKHQDSFEQQIQQYREQKDAFFKESEKSPIEDKEHFTGLNYFDPERKYRVKATLQPIHEQSNIIVKRNDGREDVYRKFAKASFELEGEKYQLTLLINQLESDSQLVAFIPFYDKTNGDETYQGGRYLDVKIQKDDEAIIDFNFAYNPFCVYSYKFSCPLPPEENFINLHIRAGEKIWKNHDEE
ncbi:MAG: DUF1684 domain-containing protein [Cytophagaceae bacterium]